MKRNRTSFATAVKLLGFLVLLATTLAARSRAQESEPPIGTTTARPLFTHLPPRTTKDTVTPLNQLPVWNGSFTYNSKSYPFTMVGADPITDGETVIVVRIIPLKIIVNPCLQPPCCPVVKEDPSDSAHLQPPCQPPVTFDPSHVLPDGETVIQNSIKSPIFDSTTTYIQGGIDVGMTQYVDAFQRANFWGGGFNAQSDPENLGPNYHVLLASPVVAPEQTLKVPAADGKVGSPFGARAGLVDINWFDTQLQSIIQKLNLTPNVLPIFLTYDVYLTESGQCCIGGYHSAVGSASAPQTYLEATYVDQVGAFAQDVSALSSEVGAWMDDPYVGLNGNNNTPCGPLEVGLPLQNNSNYGAYPYVLHGFTYNLQDLVTLPYFGAPPSTSVNDWFTFQGESLSICQNGS